MIAQWINLLAMNLTTLVWLSKGTRISVSYTMSLQGSIPGVKRPKHKLVAMSAHHTEVWNERSNLSCAANKTVSCATDARSSMYVAVPLATLLCIEFVAKLNERSERESGRQSSITSLFGMRQKHRGSQNTNVVISSHRRAGGSRLSEFHALKLQVEL